MAIGAFCGVAPFFFRKKLFRNQKKSVSKVSKVASQPKIPESGPIKSSAMDIRTTKVSSSYGVATIPELEPRKSSEMDIRSSKVSSSYGVATKTELEHKISSFRDLLDLSPCAGSASVNELLILTLKDLLKLYPCINRAVSVLEIEHATMHKAIKLLCDALKSLGDLWAKDAWMIQCKYDSSMEFEDIDVEKIALEMLDDMIKLARERMFDTMDEDVERSGTTTFEEAFSESYSDSKMSVSSSPETPTSVLPWKASTQIEKTPYSLTLLIRPRVLAIRKLNPIDVKHLSLDMFPHTVVQDPRYLVQLGEIGKEDEECKMRGADINEVNHNLGMIKRIDGVDSPAWAMKVDTIKETSVKLSPPTPPPVAPSSPIGLTLPSMTLLKLAPSPPPTPCVESQKIVPTPPPSPPPTPRVESQKIVPAPPPSPPQMALRDGSPTLPPHVMSSERVSASPPLSPPVMSSDIVSTPPPSPPQTASRNDAPPPPHVMSSERVYASPPPPQPHVVSSERVYAPPPQQPHVVSSEIVSAPPPPPGMTLRNGAQPPTPPMAKGAVPPPPPGLGGAKNLHLMKSASKLKRSSQMGNLYRLLKGKVEGSSVDVKVSGRKGRVGAASGGKQGMADALAEMTKRSAYFQQIEEDVKNHAESIKEVKNAISSFQAFDMVELLKFYKYVESHLEKLTDETQVLARFEDFPTKKLEALRMAAALYSKLDSIASTLQNWPIVSPVRQLLDKAESFFNKIKGEIEALERTKDEEAKKFQGHKIKFDFGILVRVKELMVDLSSSCMELALKEKKDDISQEKSEFKCERRNSRPEKILWKSFQFAFRVYSFAGGHDDRADKLTRELADEIETDPLH